MQPGLAAAKSDAQRKEIRKKYRPLTIKDLSLVREKWDDADINTSNEIELLPDSMGIL